MKEEILYALALYQTANVGTKTTLELLAHFGKYPKIFDAKLSKLLNVKGFGEKKANEFLASKNEALKKAEKELRFIQKNNIDILFYNDENYPTRLKECHDAPFLLFCKGNYNFNVSKTISIVGTRHATEYGKKITQQIVDDLSSIDVCIISGLALGIDSMAHQNAIKNNLQNIAVLGHGLDMVYPTINNSLAKKIEENGALVTDFFTETKPNKQNFPRRNRIVAGMSDAVLVIESAEKGGALITAEIANSYNREVLAIPGNIDQKYSAGCNAIIKENKAQLVTNAKDIIELLNWDIEKKPKKNTNQQTALFIHLADDEQLVYNIIKENEKIHIDTLASQSNRSSTNISNILLQLELKDLIRSLPGKHYTAS